jgi:hypothetical protein
MNYTYLHEVCLPLRFNKKGEINSLTGRLLVNKIQNLCTRVTVSLQHNFNSTLTLNLRLNWNDFTFS